MRIGIAFPAASDRDRDIADVDRLLYHLACVLEAIGFVEAVLAVDTGGNAADEASLFAHRGATIRLADADAAIDVLIVTPGVIAAEWLACFRARGGRVVLVDPGSSHARLIETTLFDVRSHSAAPSRAIRSGCAARRDPPRRSCGHSIDAR